MGEKEKGFLQKLVGKMDEKMKQKSEKCCCCSGKEESKEE